MFTNINPFKLNSILSQKKCFGIKGGDIASKEIIIPAGNTGITPGPVLSEFKEAVGYQDRSGEYLGKQGHNGS